MERKGATSKLVKGGLSGKITRQWIERVTGFSSQYDETRWSADRVIGPPAVFPRYGDEPGSWACGEVNEHQFIEVQFKEPVYIQEINIYETYNAGGVKRVQGRSGNGQWETMYETPNVTHITTSRIFSPPLKPLSYRCANIRIEVDCSVSESWVEIDAVELVGTTFNLPELTPISDLSSDLKNMVNSPDYSDVRFSVNGQEFYGHKVILAARSGYFRTLFDSGNKDSGMKKPIEMKDTTTHGFHSLLHFLYTTQIPEDLYQGRQLVDIVRAADHFMCEGLKLLAINLLYNSLKDENVVDVYTVATRPPVLGEIKTCCLDYMKSNMSTVSKSSEFAELPKEVMLDIIQQINSLTL